ncbi:MAG: acylphosphatase [Rhodothermales bacterium]
MVSGVSERLDAHVLGRVQGVGFRHFVTQQARRIGVDGWVRNEPDGSVRVAAEGPRDALEELVARLREGPAGARVHDVHTNWSRASNEFAGFTVRYF